MNTELRNLLNLRWENSDVSEASLKENLAHITTGNSSQINRPADIDFGLELLRLNQGILPLIETLHQELTNANDPKLRAKACGLLADILNDSSLPVMAQEVPVLVQFFCDRLKDQSSVGESIRALIALHDFMDGESALKILRTIFAEITVQNFAQTVRGSIFRLFSVLLARNVDTVKAQMNVDFLVGFIQAVDSEKDPRNLLIAFRLSRWVIQNFSIQELAEDLFEVTACYFPITFRPPPNDPFGITAEDLKLELRNCMIASPLFGPYAMPLLLEKLGSTSTGARRDAIDTLAAGLPIYGIQILQENMHEIWKMCQSILQGSEEELIDPAINLIVSILQALKIQGQSIGISHEDGSKGSLLTEFLGVLYEDSLKNISQGDTKFAKVYRRALVAFARANAESCEYIAEKWLPLLIEDYNETSSSFQKRRQCIESFCELIASTKETIKGEISSLHPLFTKKIQLFNLLLLTLNAQDVTATVKRAALMGLRDMVEIQSLLDDPEMVLLVEYVAGIAFNLDSSAAAEPASLLRSVATRRPAPVAEYFLPILTSGLMDTTRSPSVSLCFAQELMSVPELAHEIISLLCQSCQESLQSSSSTAERKSEIILGLKKIVEANVLSESQKREVVELLSEIVAVLPAERQKPEIENAFFDLFSICTRAFEFEIMTDLIQKIGNGFFEDRLSIASLYSAVLGNLKPENINQLKSNISTSDFLCKLWEHAKPSTDHSMHEFAAKSIAVIMNKLPTDKTRECTEIFEKMISESLKSSEDNVRHAAAVLLIWVTKALVLRAESRGFELLKSCIIHIDDPNSGTEFANGFSIIAGKTGRIFEKSGFATIKLLYQQRLFSQCIPLLESQFRAASEKRRHLYLIAVSHILRNTPSEVLLSGVSSLMPILFSSIQCSTEPDLILSTLLTLDMILRDSPKFAIPHAGTLIKSCLKIAGSNEPKQPAAVRCAAIRCLSSCASFPYQTIYPYKSSVIQDLALCVDDPKRFVRNEAVYCRNKWFLQQ